MKTLLATAALSISLFLSSAQAQLKPSQSSLEGALKQWSGETRGSVLAIEPGSVRPYSFELMRRNRGQAPAPPMPEPREGDFRSTLAYYGRKLMECGSVKVVAPIEMKVLDTKFPAPDLLAGMESPEKIRLLAGSLSQGQWKMIASPRGVGAADLNRDQRVIFDSLLPNPFVVSKGRVQGNSLNTGMDRTTLPPETRAQVRIRLNRLLTYSFPSQQPGTWVTFNDGRPRTPGDEVLIVEGGRMHAPDYGAVLSLYLPNKQKPGDLRFESAPLDARIVLSVGKKEKVSELIRRIASATGYELYVDPRAGSFEVWTAGQSARSGDVLRALCLALTGAFRKVGPAYVLTDDLEGIGSRVCLINERLGHFITSMIEMRNAANEAIRASRGERQIEFAPDASLPAAVDRLLSIRAPWTRYEEGGHLDVAMSELSSDWQNRLRQEVERGNAMMRPRAEETVQYATSDRVRISASMNLSFIIPGVGVVEDGIRGGSGYGTHGGPIENGSPAPKPAVDFRSVPVRALHIAPSTAQEAETLITEAKERGFSEIWVETPEMRARELLETVVKSCRERDLKVVAVVRLLFRSGEGDPQKPDTERNALGEASSAYRKRTAPKTLERAPEHWRERYAREGDWLRIDTPELREAAARRVLDIAAIPDLDGLALRDTAAPGFLDAAKADYEVARQGWDFGYVDAYRVAFLRQASLDPIDLPSYMGGNDYQLDLPFFSTERARPKYTFEGGKPTRAGGRTVQQLWNGFRNGENLKFMTDLFGKLNAAAIPLYVQGRWSLENAMVPGRYVRWEMGDSVPDFSFDQPEVRQKSLQVSAIASFSHMAWLHSDATQRMAGDFRPLRKDDPAAFAADAARVFNQAEGNIEGVSIDLSDLPVERALEFLRALGK